MLRVPKILLLAALVLVASKTVAYEQEIDRLSIAIGEKIRIAGKSRVAVVDFTDLQGRVTELGRWRMSRMRRRLTATSREMRRKPWAR